MNIFNNVLSLGADNQAWFIVILVWVLVWKGLALWKAAHKEQKWWFIALLVVNTLGILEILYIYVFSDGLKKKTTEISDKK